MKIFFLTQGFYPDTVSVSQHLSDLAFEFQKAIDLIHSQRQEIVNRGKLQCSYFSWDKCYEETKLVYEEIL